MGAHVLFNGVFLNFFQVLDIVQGEDPVVAGGTFDGDEAVFLPVADGGRNHAQHLRHLVDGKGHVVVVIHDRWFLCFSQMAQPRAAVFLFVIVWDFDWKVKDAADAVTWGARERGNPRCGGSRGSG